MYNRITYILYIFMYISYQQLTHEEKLIHTIMHKLHCPCQSPTSFNINIMKINFNIIIDNQQQKEKEQEQERAPPPPPAPAPAPPPSSPPLHHHIIIIIMVSIIIIIIIIIIVVVVVVVIIIIIIIIINNNNNNKNNKFCYIIPASLHPILRSKELQQVAHVAEPPPPSKEGGLESVGAIQPCSGCIHPVESKGKYGDCK